MTRLQVCAWTLLCGALAGTAIASPPLAEELRAEAETEKPWSLDITVDAVSQYFFRGYNLNPGADFIIQPGAEFSYKLLESDEVAVSGYIATWANLANGVGDVHSPRNVYEFDLYGGVNVDYKNFTFGAIYTLYFYPNRSYGQQQEVGLTLSYDDSAIWEDSAVFAGINPHAGYYFELEDRGDSDRNDYFEFGIEPTLKPVDVLGTEITFSLPAAVGLSADGYYTDSDGRNETLGYYIVGVTAEVPLTFIPETAGEWSLTIGVDYVRLLSDSARQSNGGDRDDFVGRIGLTVSL